MARYIFPVTIDYSQSFSDMIAAGKYNYVASDITAENFPISGKIDIEIELIHFNRIMESDDVLKELNKAGFRPATLAELLAFDAKYPDKQSEFPIIALGSIWWQCGRRTVPEIWSDCRGRSLLIFWFGCILNKNYRFAAVRI